MLQGTQYLPWGDQGHLSRQYLYCILLQGLFQPRKRKTTPQWVEESTGKRQEDRKTEGNKSKIEMRSRREKGIFGRICGEWEKKD